MFVENDNTDVVLDGKVVVEYYSANMVDFHRFERELRAIAEAEGINEITNLLGHTFTIDEYLDWERPIVQKAVHDRMTDI